jgi:hypothetical protein
VYFQERLAHLILQHYQERAPWWNNNYSGRELALLSTARIHLVCICMCVRYASISGCLMVLARSTHTTPCLNRMRANLHQSLFRHYICARNNFCRNDTASQHFSLLKNILRNYFLFLNGSCPHFAHKLPNKLRISAFRELWAYTTKGESTYLHDKFGACHLTKNLTEHLQKSWLLNVFEFIGVQI